jgi:hypothetical protein
MSDLSMPRCERCGQPEYACSCTDARCADCGDELTPEELAIGREVCFSCYCVAQD